MNVYEIRTEALRLAVKRAEGNSSLNVLEIARRYEAYITLGRI